MQQSIYENHRHEDPNFPIIFHYDIRDIYDSYFVMHYHENIEILHFLEGEGLVTLGLTPIKVSPGDTLIIHPNMLHAIYSESDCRYFCLIIDKVFYESFDVNLKDLALQPLLQDNYISEIFSQIEKEVKSGSPYYKLAVKSLSIQLLTYLRCHYTSASSPVLEKVHTQKITLVKKAIHYIHTHFQNELSIDMICQSVGFSKYYFCRVFKEVTGQTAIEYLNFLRCDHARKLLNSGQYNVTESAEQSGFKNLSYFSKSYKKYIGNLPSDETKPKL